jgi:nitronate monooxygenase
MWKDRRILDLFGMDLPILLAPMAGSGGSELAIAVAEAGGLGSLPCAMLNPEQIRTELGIIRQRTDRPINLNFFCHRPPQPDAAREAAWRRRLAVYYAEFGIDPASVPAGPGRNPFDAESCAIVEEYRPEVVSFHFGLPEEPLLERVRKSGAKFIASATTVAEAKWLEERGCDAIIAQGAEAGGHRGIFLEDDISTQPGTMALIPQVVDAVSVPVIAARGLVNRFIREVGPLNAEAPAFPLATGAFAPLRKAAEEAGSGDFSPLWAGQAAALAKPLPARELTVSIAEKAAALLEGG